MLVELLQGNLPWRRLKDKDKIGQMKQDWNNPELVAGLPSELLTMMDHLQSLTFDDTPDYAYLKGLLLTALTRNGGLTNECVPFLILLTVLIDDSEFFWVNLSPPEHLNSSRSISSDKRSQNQSLERSVTSHSIVFESTEGLKENATPPPSPGHGGGGRFLLLASTPNEGGTFSLPSLSLRVFLR